MAEQSRFCKIYEIINPLVPVGYEICNSQLDTSHLFPLDSGKNRFFLEEGGGVKQGWTAVEGFLATWNMHL